MGPNKKRHETAGAGGPGLRVTVNPRKVTAWMVVLSCALTVMSAVAAVVKFHNHGADGWNFFNVDYERNLPTLYQATTLLFSSFLFAVCGRFEAARSSRPARSWKLLSAIFFLMYADELCTLHEMSGLPLRDYFHATGVFYYGWMIVAIPLVAVLFISLLGFLKRLPPATRGGLILAGAVYVAGALGFEMWASFVNWKQGYSPELQSILGHIEEFLEMAGVILLVRTLLNHLIATEGTDRFTIGRS